MIYVYVIISFLIGTIVGTLWGIHKCSKELEDSQVLRRNINSLNDHINTGNEEVTKKVKLFVIDSLINYVNNSRKK